MSLACFAAACGPRRPDWMAPPTIDAASMVQAIFQTADADRDGRLTAAELAALPALKDALQPLDQDGDKQLSEAEIVAWWERVRSENVTAAEAPVVVTHRGKPLADVLVKLVPEPCMGGRISVAEGRTDATGLVFLNRPTSRIAGVDCGLYRVEISGTGSDGQPLPAKYNSATRLGVAIGGGLPQERTAAFVLD